MLFIPANAPFIPFCLHCSVLDSYNKTIKETGPKRKRVYCLFA